MHLASGAGDGGGLTMRVRDRFGRLSLVLVAATAAVTSTAAFTATGRTAPGGGAADHQLPVGQRRVPRGPDHVRQRALLPGQPQRPVRPGADAPPAQLHPEQRDHAVEQPHPVDRSHRHRQPDQLHRPVRRPPWHSGVQQLPHLQSRWHHRYRGVVRLLDRAGLRPGTVPGPRHHPGNGVFAHRAGQLEPPEHHHPGALGALHPGRLQRRRCVDRQHGARERRCRHPHRVRAHLARGRSACGRPHRLQERRDRRLRRARRSLRPG